MQQAPSVGRIVHYTSHGTPDGTYGKECRAAIITAVPTDGTVNLTVFNPTGTFFNAAEYDDSDDPRGGTWHWPERV